MSMKRIDPSTIDLKMAIEMTSGEFTEPLSYKSNFFPEMIDFDELEKVKPPKGYKFKLFSRDLKIEITSFRGVCPGAVHYYCTIKFFTPLLYKGNVTGGGARWPKIGGIFGLDRMDVHRPVTAEDLADKHVDWTGYYVGDMTHRWYDTQNAIECAKRIIELRFRNHGEVEVENYAN